MDAKELRLGNIVLYDETIYSHGITTEEIIVDAKFILSLKESYSDYSDMIKGIPLTEEWLLKFGFKKTMDDEYKKVWDSSIDQFWIEWNETFGIYPKYNGQPIRNIKYVHQLQNLYFALTGKELEINE